ncbi:unnamed protein product [Protopolystoma xenopodis]|uniref:Uncharacterized protein n=1 Tax=Protopolystoma xenopodis TaxID=117903 RepID=A0A3S5B0R6_9PLAT|nr:unnamed protein product [Protopolystoma xenopodis]
MKNLYMPLLRVLPYCCSHTALLLLLPASLGISSQQDPEGNNSLTKPAWHKKVVGLCWWLPEPGKRRYKCSPEWEDWLDELVGYEAAPPSSNHHSSRTLKFSHKQMNGR